MKSKILISSLKPFGMDITGLNEDSIVERKQFLPSIKMMEDEECTAICSMSTESVDADGDMVMAKGCDLSRFQKNPVICWSHDYSKPAIGKATEVQITDKGVVGKIKFAPTPMGQEIFNLVKGGFLRTCSVGFITNESYPSGSKEFKSYCKDNCIEPPCNCKRIISKWTLLENSMVNIPSNPDALVAAVSSKSIKIDEKLQKDLGIEVKGVENPSSTEAQPTVISRPMNPHESVQLAINDAVNLLMANFGLEKLNEWLKSNGYSEIAITKPSDAESLIVEPRELNEVVVSPDAPILTEAVPNYVAGEGSQGDNGAAAKETVQSGSEPLKNELPDNTEESIESPESVNEEGGGSGKGEQESGSEYKIGMEVEKEHSEDEEIRNKITTDHLKEYPDYYSKIATVLPDVAKIKESIEGKVVEAIEDIKPIEQPEDKPKPSYVVISNGATTITVDMKKKVLDEVMREIELVKKGKIL